MKPYNSKQLAWSQGKAFGSALNYLGQLFSFVLFVFFVYTFAISIVGDVSAAVPTAMAIGPIILFTMADIGNIDQPGDRDTAPNQIGFRLYLIERSQIDDTVTFPTPDSSRELATIPLADGETMHHFDTIENSVKYTGTGEKGDVTSTFGKTIPAIISYTDKGLDFCENFQGKGFILIYSECESGTKMVVGTFCKPVYLKKFEVKEDSDGKYITLEFGNDHWRQPLTYIGTIIEQDPITIAADETDLAITSGNYNYLLSDGSAASVALATVSGIGSSDYSYTITINAPATSSFAPTIAHNTVFILKDEETWTANSGSSITFQILDDTTLVEKSRIQTGA
jgi:hypothetical protein